MSEQDNPSSRATEVSPNVVVESVSSNRTVPFKPIELQDVGVPDLHQKRAPAVTTADTVPESLKDSTAGPDNKEQKGSQHETTSEKHKHAAKKLSSNISSSKRESKPAVAIPMEPTETEKKKSSAVTTVAPSSTIVTPIPDIEAKRDIKEEIADLDSITSDITELRSPEAVKRTKEWSDEEEAGGLPRSESRASHSSRVVRAVRELFCCGVRLEAPSEDNMSSPREGFFRSGI